MVIRKLVFRFLFVVLFTLPGGLPTSAAEKLKIVCTTSLIESIVKEIGKEKIDLVTTIVPGGMCPGHFDLKPKDIEAVSQAKVFLYHGWEGWLPKLLSSINSKELILKRVDIKGNWMIPHIYTQAIEKVTHILCEVDIDNSPYFWKNAKKYIQKIQFFAKNIKRLKKRFKDIKAIASCMQAPFLEYLGIKVVATYGRPDELSSLEMVRLIKIAKEEKVTLVVDNLQSGPNVGRQIAEELNLSRVKARHIILTNFPLRGSYLDSLKDNIKSILQALK